MSLSNQASKLGPYGGDLKVGNWTYIFLLLAISGIVQAQEHLRGPPVHCFCTQLQMLF